MKRHSLISSSSALASAALLAVTAEGFYPFASGELYLKAEPQLQYDSNIYANSFEESDWVARVPVGLLAIRDVGHIRTEVTGGVEFGFFEEFDHDNYADPFARARFDYDREGHPLRADLDLGWWRETRADPQVLTLDPEDGRLEQPQVERQSAGLTTRYRTGRRLGVRGALDYDSWEYNRGYLSDRERFGFSGGAEYSYSPRLDVGLNYAYRRTDVTARSDAPTERGLSTDDHAVYVSARGQILPRVEQEVEVGIKHREFEDNMEDSQTLPYLSLSLIWEADERTQLRVTGVSDYSFSAENASVSEQRLEGELRRRIDPKILVAGFARYTRQDFDYLDLADRQDDEVGAGVRLEYIFTELIEGRLGAEYVRRSSTVDYADYDRYVISAALLYQY